MAFGIPAGMKWTSAAALALVGWSMAAPPVAVAAPLDDAAFLNIGLACRWDGQCMTLQRRAMTHALDYVRKTKPAGWRVHLCNRNARRVYSRVDWIGFDHCIRNLQLSRAVANDARRRAHH